MFKVKQEKILSWVLVFVLIISSLIGPNTTQIVKAATNDGTSDNPYGVTQAIGIQDNSIATVQGYIVGQPIYDASMPNGLFTSSSFTSNTAIAIADTIGETDASKVIYVQLPSSPTSFRATWNLKDNSSKMGSSVKITGVLQNYFGTHPGLKSPTAIVDATIDADVAVTGVSLDKNTLSLGVGQTSALAPTIAPTTATNKNVTWSSSNVAVATVTNGLVTAGTTEGEATITATTEDGAKTSLCVVTVTANAPPVNKTLDIVGITDFHGQLLDSTNTKPVGAALAKQIKDVKTANPNGTLIIGGGDLYQGTPVSNVLRGVPVQKVLSNIGMEVTALGNHEFDWGLDVVNKTTMTGANYNIVCANMYNKGTTDRPYVPYKIIIKDGVRIAVIGAILKDAPTIIMPNFIAPFDIKDPATEINACAKEIIDGNLADVVLADVHDGGASLNTIVNNLHGVDAVFGGHTHTSGDDVIKDADGHDVPTLNAASTGKGYIDLKITVDSTNKIVGFSPKGQNYKVLTTTTTSAVDAECKTIVDAASADLLPIFNEKIGNDAEAYSSTQVDSPYGESQLGNWMADVVKNKANADVGMVNNGGIRLSPIPAGDITVGTIFNIMPFDNIVTTVTMTGAQLKVLFEQAVADTTGKGVQISGVKFAYDSSKTSYKQAIKAADGTITTPEVPGQRITSITRESDNSVVKDTDSLLVAAPDFVATGGDNFTEFTLPSIAATYVDSHVLVRDALTEDVRAKGKISVTMNNRIDNQMAVGTALPMTIAEARTATGSVIVTGFVSSVNGKNVFIQDNIAAPTAGICVYNSAGATINKGDKISVTGPLSTYSGLVEITPSSADGVTIINSGNVITPKEVTIGAISDTLQGQLIKVKNVKFTSIDTTGSSMIQDLTGSVVVYAMPVVDGLVANDSADVTAIVTRYGTTLELSVGSATDVVKIGGTVKTPPAATISIVATSDVHGNVLNFDYGTNAAPSAGQGLAKVSTYVKGLRTANPNNVMLIDNGDTIQGTPLAYYYNMVDKTTLYPMAAVMGAMKYDTATLGNHEFNYGMDTLNRIIADYKSKGMNVLSANTYKTDNTNFVEPYYIKSFTVNGKTIKVGILGLTTKTIPSWENPSNYAGLHFNDLVTEAQKWVPIVKTAGADVVILAAHSGEEGTADVIPENQIKAIATSVNGIDAIIAGHTHATLNDLALKNPAGKVVPVLEPAKFATKVSQIDLNYDVDSKLTVATKNVTMDSTIVEDPAITALIAPYQSKTLEYTATVLGQSTGEYKGDKQITEPTEIMELINKVQAGAAKTDLSIAAPLSLSAYIPTGDITIKNIMGVYVYENFLYGVKMTGKQVKDWMEYTVRYYKQVMNSTDSIAKDSKLNIADYNLDQLYGANYDIDLTQPACTLDSNGRVVVGNRIQNLKFKGNIVKDTDVFTVAINNYRYNGGGGFMAAAGISNTDSSIVTYDSAKALGDDGQVRSLMMKYVQDNKTIVPSTSNNWKLSTTTLDPDAPIVPTGLSGKVLGSDAVHLSWTAVTGATSYNVYRSTTATGGYTKVNTSAVTGSTFDDNGLNSGTAYYYGLQAVNGVANSLMSASVTVTPKATALPEKITVTINGDSSTTKAFTWYTDKLTTGSLVQVVKKTSLLPDFTDAIEFNGSVKASNNVSLSENVTSKDEVMHIATATGLSADTQYWFRVGDKTTSSWSIAGTFKTSPVGNKAFSFIALTDTQAANADEATISANTIDQALKTIKNPEFIVHTGDMVENGSVEMQWDWLLNGSKNSLLNTTIMPAAGNHEAYNSASSSLIDHFNLPVVDGQNTTTGAYYSYDYGNAHFIVLNTNDNSAGTGPLSQAQIDWLKADVAASKKQWNILSMHKGIYTTGKHLDDTDIIASRAQLVPIMDKLNIDLIFQGHDHTYSRSKFLASGAHQATTEITETMNGEQIKYAVNPTGKMYITVNAAGPKVYGLETSNAKVTLADYFSLFARNEQPAMDPKYTPETNGDPKRGVVQQFAGITIDGNKLTYMAYKIEGGQTTLVDTYGIVKVDEPTAVNDAIAALPAVITLTDKAAVVKARTSYDVLSEIQKILIINIAKLNASETTIANLEKVAEDKATADKAAAQAAADKVAAQAAADKAVAQAAADKAVAQAAADKAVAQATADKVIDAIAAITAVPTLTDKATVDKARTAYEALSDAQKALVTNVAKLTAAETKIDLETSVTSVTLIINKIKAASIGSTIESDITANSVVSKDIFNAIRGQDKNITFQSEGISWTFNGKNITSLVTSDIDLSLKAVPDALKRKEVAKVKQVTGKDEILIPFSFNYDGQLPGLATVKILISKNWAGKSVTICRYFEDKNTYETITTAAVDDDGYITIKLNHCSDYFVTQATNLPQTGSPFDMSVFIGFGVALLAVGIFILGIENKKRRKKIL